MNTVETKYLVTLSLPVQPSPELENATGFQFYYVVDVPENLMPDEALAYATEKIVDFVFSKMEVEVEDET